MAQLFALLVGINEYHPQSGVTNLRGCMNDVSAMQAFLTTKYPELTPNIKLLLNKDATRENILAAFKDHLSKAKTGDYALFYYSGHGSYEPTSQEFIKLDSKAQNETMVCYDSRCAGKQDLADKELAVLLSRISDGAQKIVILDSCHSGSATRSVGEAGQGLRRFEQPRFNNESTASRSIKDYLGTGDTYFSKQTGAVSINLPSSPHLLMSACDREEVAMETKDQRGLFTKTLIQVLTDNALQITYADLQQRVRAAIKADGGKQTPKIEAFEAFSANRKFLSSEILDASRHWVRFDTANQRWEMDFGAVHGMPTATNQISQVKLRLFKDTPGRKPTTTPQATATVLQVSTTKSVLKLVSKSSIAPISTSTKYLAEFTFLPQANCVPIWLNAQPALKTQFLQWFGTNGNAAITWINQPAGAKYELRCSGKNISLYHLASGSLIQGFEAHTQAAADYMIGILNHVEKWERIWRLNKKAEVLDMGDFSIRFSQITKTQQVLQTWDFEPNLESNVVPLDYDFENGAWTPQFYKVEVENRSDKPVQVMLLFLSRFFDIESFYPSETLKNGVGFVELKKGGLVILDEKLSEVINRFKIIISTEDIVTATFTQPELELGKTILPSRSAEVASRGDQIDFDVAPVEKEDFFITNFDVVLSRCLSAITPSKEVVLKDTGIKIGAHPTFKGKISLLGAPSATRSILDNDDLTPFAEALGGSIVNLNGTASRSAADSALTTIQISDIENSASLAQNPLNLELNMAMSDKEQLVAVTRDAATGLILPVGQMKRVSNTQSQLVISTIPETSAQSRSIGRALKFVLLKIAFKKEESIFLLRQVIYKADGSMEQTETGVEMAIKKSKKVLLVTHGIIGNTTEQAKAFRFAKDKGYDLVLTWDYENLNTKIEDIATKLDTLLRKYSFGPTDNRELHIVAHSLGGLVSRYMIENLNASAYVNRLIMCGTPNGGSIFGKAPGALQGLNWLLGLGLNFVPKIVSDIVSKITSASSMVFVTLGQMDPSSEFIKKLKLNTRSSATQYLVLAGNIHTYKGGDQSAMASLFEKLELQIGKLAYWGKPNDIAVALEAIKDVPSLKTGEIFDLGCHHLNYFVNEQSLAKLKEVL